MTVPLWLFLHLLTSPVAQHFPGSHPNSVLLVSNLDLKILPLSVSLGYIVPSILMALPTSSMVFPFQHQRYIALWQPFPIWCLVIHWSTRYLCNMMASKMPKEKPNKRPSIALGTSYLNSAKHVYRFIFGLCLLTHIPAVLIALLPSAIFPDSVSILQSLSEKTFFDIFVPYFPVLNHEALNFAAGVHTFLQWDVYIGTASMLLWAVLLHRNAMTEKTIVDPNTSLPIYKELLSGERSRDMMLWRKLLWKICLWTLVSGPMGAVAILLWERDTIVRQKTKHGM